MMMLNVRNLRQLSALLCASFLSFNAATATPAATLPAEKIHFLVPGGAGGGWDITARGTGEALMKSGLVKHVSYQNMSGGGGGKAIAYLVETAKKQPDTLMINSTPIVVRALAKEFPQSFRDLTPVASIVGDYAAFVVKQDSPFKTWQDIVEVIKKEPRKIKIGGGSAQGSMDHLVAAMAYKAASVDPKQLVYIAYDAGGKAVAALLSGEVQVISTGLGEVIDLAKAGQVRVLAITADKRVEDFADIPTLKEQGYNVSFTNWRGLFAPPGVATDKVDAYVQIVQKMYNTPEWEAIRKRNGWINLYKPKQEFLAFLENQEKDLGSMMKELGFMK